MEAPRYPLARVLASVINGHQQEGARVARLLHDDISQTLSAVGLHLDLLRMDVEAECPETARRISEAQKMLERTVEQVRALSYELNPEIVERAGLQVALERLVGRYREIVRQPIRLLYDSSVRVPSQVAAGMYKIAECALDNAARHSGARHIEIYVRQARRGAVTLEVRDDGAGFDSEAVGLEAPGLGLLLMKCYAEQGDLGLEVKSRHGEGTIVKVRAAGAEPV